MSTEITEEDFRDAYDQRAPRFLAKSATAAAQGATSSAASSVRGSPSKWRQSAAKRTQSEPKFPSPTKVVVDLGKAEIAEDEKPAPSFILQERQLRKKKEAQEVARGMQSTSLTEKEAQDLVELETKRLERMQQSIEWIKQNEEERAKSGGVAPMMSV